MRTSDSPCVRAPRKLQKAAESTTDFVHFVVHFLARHDGVPCSLCTGSAPLRHTHYFETPVKAR